MDTFRKTTFSALRFDDEGQISKVKLTLFLILCLALFLRLINVLNASVIDVDGTVYAQMGESFSQGAFRDGLRGVFPPFYPFLIGIAHLFVPDIELAGRLVSLITGVLLVYISFLFLKNFMGEQKALFGAFFVAIHPYLIKSSASVLTESLATTLFFVAVFTFYKGLTRKSPILLGLSGFTLSLTYLTRPEYLVCLIPMCLVLLVKRRFLHIFIFVLCFSIFAIPYIYFMKVETGLLVLSKKAILAKNRDVYRVSFSLHSYLFPMVSAARIVRYIPVVIYDFLNALQPHFLALVILGIQRIEKRYKVLVALLIIFHLMTVAAVNASSKRFYFEFIPLTVPFAVAGVYVLKEFFERHGYRMVFYHLLMAIVIGVLLFQGYSSPDRGRGLHKQAGLYLMELDPGKQIASRLPFVPFYSRGLWIVAPAASNCNQLLDVVRKKEPKYLIVDDGMLNKTFKTEDCLPPLVAVKEFRDNGDFVIIYKVTDG